MGIGWEIIGFIFVVGRRMGRPGMMAVDGLCVSVCWPEVGDYIVTKIMERFGEEAEQGSETRLGLLLVRCAEEDKPRMQSECRRKSQGKMEMGGEGRGGRGEIYGHGWESVDRRVARSGTLPLSGISCSSSCLLILIYLRLLSARAFLSFFYLSASWLLPPSTRRFVGYHIDQATSHNVDCCLANNPAAMSIATRPFHANHAPFLETGHDDPLAQALQPPPNESPDERALREKLQREASMISHAIDEDIQEARKAFERRKKAVKILLLGERFLYALPNPPCLRSLWTLVLPIWIFPQEHFVADMWRSRSGRVRQEHYTQE